MRKLAILIFSFGLCFLTGCAANPITGEDEMMFSQDYHSDIELGKQISPEVEKELKGKIEDVNLQNYIGEVGRRIVVVCHNPDFDFNFIAVNDKSVNAVSLPGGHIFITKGILLKMKNEFKHNKKHSCNA